jgi:activator of HSP90 ATPase
VYPSPEMVGDLRRYTYLWDLETPIDHDLIAEHSKDIEAHTKDAVAKHSQDGATRRNKVTAKHSRSEKKSTTTSKTAAFSAEQMLAPLGFD